MNRMIKNLVTRKAALTLAAVIGLGGIAATSQPAQAGFRIGIDLRDHDGYRGPAYEDRTTQVWVEPTYRTVCDRVWVAGEMQTVTDRVWVPDRYEQRDVTRWDGRRRYTQCVTVLVAPAHYELQNRQVQVSQGHWADVQRQELVTPGHWETRVERVACGPTQDDGHIRIEFGHR